MGRLESRRLVAVPAPADTPDSLELDRVLLRLAGRPVRHDHALLPAAVRPAGAVRGVAPDPNCRLQIANCTLGATAICNMQYATCNSLAAIAVGAARHARLGLRLHADLHAATFARCRFALDLCAYPTRRDAHI